MAITNHLAFQLSISSSKTFIFRSFPATQKALPPFKPSSKNSKSIIRTTDSVTTSIQFNASARANDVATSTTTTEMEVAEGYTISQFCDKIIDIFMNEKPKIKEWRKFLVFREEWKKYRESFYSQCQRRADWESDPSMKEKFISLERKVKRIDDEMEINSELLKELQDSPTDINAIVAKRRKEFTEDFFKFLTLISETHDSLEDRDAVARLVAKCLSAVSAYDRTLENVETLNSAQVKFDDILNSPSLDVACEKIASLAKTKELDSSLILLINSAWASAKESTTMKNEVKEIMYQLYRATKSSLRSMAPKEIKLLKHLLNIIDPEERFSALATAFAPGDGSEAKDRNAMYTTPKELHKWIKIMLDSYHLNQEDTEIREARQMAQPVVIQRLFVLKETIESEYLEQNEFPNSQTKPNHGSGDAVSI